MFQSHPSGSLLMKELKQPWQNWHSPRAAIGDHAFPEDDPRRTPEWFTGKDRRGAYAFSDDAAKPAIRRWATQRFHGGAAPGPGPVLEQILDTQTANLVTSMTKSSALPAASVDLPKTFFADVDGLSSVGLDPPPATFTVAGDVYQRCLEAFDVGMEDGNGFARKGDTHFCFLVPERATSTFSEDMAANILAASGPAEAEFAERWQVGEDFAGPFNAILGGY